MSSVLLLRGHKLLVLGTWESSCLLLRNYLLDPNPTTSTPLQLLEYLSAMIHIMRFCFATGY